MKLIPMLTKMSYFPVIFVNFIVELSVDKKIQFFLLYHGSSFPDNHANWGLKSVIFYFNDDNQELTILISKHVHSRLKPLKLADLVVEAHPFTFGPWPWSRSAVRAWSSGVWCPSRACKPWPSRLLSDFSRWWPWCDDGRTSSTATARDRTSTPRTKLICTAEWVSKKMGIPRGKPGA